MPDAVVRGLGHAVDVRLLCLLRLLGCFGKGSAGNDDHDRLYSIYMYINYIICIYIYIYLHHVYMYVHVYVHPYVVSSTSIR